MIHSYPFRPNNPAKKGYNKTIGKFPVYYEETQEKKQLKTETNKRDQPVWM